MASPFITGQTPGSPRNNFGAPVGFKFTVGGASILVTSLGRWVLSGNSGSHLLEIYRYNTSAVIASVTVNTSGATANAYLYGAITPVTLNAGESYAIQSTEVNGGDNFCDLTPITHDAAFGGSVTAEYAYINAGPGDFSYGPLNFLISVTNDYVYAGSGGIAFGGVATTGMAHDYPYTGGGGLSFGGAAATSVQHSHPYTGSGGLAFGGSATTSVQHAHPYTSSGGITFSGTAVVARTVTHPYAGSGGLTFGGEADTGKFVYYGSGGLTFGGAALTVAAAATLQRGKSAVLVSAKASGAVRIG